MCNRIRLATFSLAFSWILAFPLYGSAVAQIAGSAGPQTAQAEAPKDSLGRSTPRGAVLGFLGAAHKGDDELAAEYLNTRLRGKPAADLAHDLFVVLDRGLPPRLNQLSDNPDGSLSDPRNRNQDLVGRIPGLNGEADIVVERVDRGKSGLIWLFSKKTLDSIPDLYKEISLVAVDTVLPPFLVNIRVAGIALFEWIAVLVGLPFFYLLTVLLDRTLSPLAGVLRRRLSHKPSLPDPQLLPNPIRVLLLAFFIHWTLSKVGLSLLARQFWSSLASAITIAGCVWLLILLNRRVEEHLRRRLQSANHTGAASLLRLMRWAIDLLVIFVGVFVALHYWGIRPTAALAGLGVGGIAVAIAAQKTLENVIGAISLTIDQAARVGDFLKVGDTVGTVEEMGLRSIRIRTLDRTVVSIPNGQISDMAIEAFSLRDKFRFQPILRLRYGITSLQMRVILARIRGLLADGISVEPASFRVRFLGFGVSSLDVEIFAYILARDWNHFLELQEGLFIQIMETLESAGVEIALPSQSIFLAAASAAENLDGHKLRKGQGANGEISEESGAAKSARREKPRS